ncbi:uncharacterized protein E0L32_002177 [Thyridium curvatum]|uniref:Heterokaryon incompatibility domain-containing protein n=1 Tax=Thyridium curvatum TaxID=1093900 RepID=A0A507AJ80_9PEZI|nr:uncharacterized protein E0L32_001956 [Thyridium curvatum]XP_030989285.1 uncharacterized protein E0L32_002177 [Thyridium curvatum]TPX07353.1 hypothetical protein E0L32_001956 [Thyridium curvatum]TPX07574.1 hypothetical protein E0L32_002177 [Thyridium curvatum]
MALAPFPGCWDSEEFQYPSLAAKPRVFRLIRLLPPARSFFPICSDTLRVEIIEADLGAAVPIEYDTLSYSWGVGAKARPDRRVIVETAGQQKRVMWIHRPLEAALRSIVANRVTDRPIFVDQICINQSDGDEKAVQVHLMGEIYSRGQRVVVWLGPSTALSDLFFDMAREMNEEGVMSRLIGPNKGHFMEIYDAVLDPDPSIELTGVKKEDRDDLLALIAKFERRFSQEAMIHVLERSWFNRLWVIQEACLAPNVTFLCGSRILCFECLRSSCAFFTFYNGNWIRTQRGTVSQHEVNRANLVFKLLQRFNRIFHERKAIHELGQKQTYYDIMLKYNVNVDSDKINCTKAEDRLFGVLGLAADEEVYNTVAVRYDDNDGDTSHSNGVFTDFASLAVCQNLDFLSLSQFPKSRDGLPTWVPDWSTDLSMSRGYLNLKKPVYSAGGPMPTILPLVDRERRQLSVSGLVIGKIMQIGSTTILQDFERPYFDNVQYQSLKRFYSEADDMLLRASNIPSCPFPYATDHRLRRLAAIRLADFDLTAKDMATRYGYDSTTAYENLEGAYEQASTLGQRLITSDEFLRDHSLSNIFRNINSWAHASETDVLHLCATDPVTGSMRWLRGCYEFAREMVILFFSSARVSLTAKWLYLKRRYGGLRFHPPNREEVLERTGLNPDRAVARHLSDYLDFVFRNRDRHLFITEGGYVGVGPASIQKGDVAVVLFGATVPHILSPRVLPDDSMEDTVWAYLGEAYCDGVMEGQFLQGVKEPETFKIV